jgi:hypothetical protein
MQILQIGMDLGNKHYLLKKIYLYYKEPLQQIKKHVLIQCNSKTSALLQYDLVRGESVGPTKEPL